MALELILLLKEFLGFSYCQGTNYTCLSDATIYVLAGLKQADKDAYDYCLVRQFHNIKQNFEVYSNLYQIITSIAVGALGYLATNSTCAAAGLSLLSMYCFISINIRLNEDAADQYAIKNCTPEMLRGGLRLYTAFEKTVTHRYKMKGLSKESAKLYGDCAYDLLHSRYHSANSKS